jgi:acetyl esterase/lipase
MAHRPGRRLAALLILLAVTACSPAAGEAEPTSSLDPSVSSTVITTTPSSTSTTTLMATTTSEVASTTGSAEVDAEIAVPSGDGPFPSVVLVHGGGWVTGSPDLLAPLSDFLVEHGYLTVNTNYALSDFEKAGFPEAVDDVACAVRLAATHPDSDGSVAVVGHSAGAHIGALVALTGDRYAADCPHPGSGVPERFVGLAGPYDVSRLGVAIVAFFGAGPEQAPDVWEAGNPQLLTDENTALDSLIIYGDEDGLVDASFALDFFEALSLSGSTALLELVEGARHNEVHDPDLVGDLIVTWLER